MFSQDCIHTFAYIFSLPAVYSFYPSIILFPVLSTSCFSHLSISSVNAKSDVFNSCFAYSSVKYFAASCAVKESIYCFLVWVLISDCTDFTISMLCWFSFSSVFSVSFCAGSCFLILFCSLLALLSPFFVSSCFSSSKISLSFCAGAITTFSASASVSCCASTSCCS